MSPKSCLAAQVTDVDLDLDQFSELLAGQPDKVKEQLQVAQVRLCCIRGSLPLSRCVSLDAHSRFSQPLAVQNAMFHALQASSVGQILISRAL